MKRYFVQTHHANPYGTQPGKKVQAVDPVSAALEMREPNGLAGFPHVTVYDGSHLWTFDGNMALIRHTETTVRWCGR